MPKPGDAFNLVTEDELAAALLLVNNKIDAVAVDLAALKADMLKRHLDDRVTKIETALRTI